MLLLVCAAVFFMLGGVGMVADWAGSYAAEQDSDDGSDPDRSGKFPSNIDEATYLQMRDEYVALRRGIEPGRPFDPQARGKAVDQLERQEKKRLIESVNGAALTTPITPDAAWTAIGPAPLPNGSGTPVSGRATAVVVDPTNSSKVYLGTAQGGVWRSLDGGTTWATIFDNAQSLAIGALALAPSNPTTLYVGTGEFNACGDCFFGAGLYRIEGRKIVISPDVSYNEIFNGTQQTRDLEVNGVHLTLSSGPRPYGRDPSKKIVLRQEWERIESVNCHPM